MNVIICGSRSFDDYDLLARKMDKLTRKIRNLMILSGHAKGADRFGERWAYERRKTFRVFHADWNKHGKAAGPIRNQEMIDEADAVIAFWDGRSPGTRDCLERARKKGIKVKVVKIKEKT